MKAMVPWYLRIAAKIVLSRLPLAYDWWKSIGLFSHGFMEDPRYAYSVFMAHREMSGMAERPGGYVGLEMGPGDSLLSAILAKATGAERYYLVDVGAFANRDVHVARGMAHHARQCGLPAPQIDDAGTLDEVLTRCGATYMTKGLTSYREIPDASVDFIWSQAVLEHVRRPEFVDLARELRRIIKPGGVSTHQVDLKDHLGGALNNLRVGTGLWERDWFASSGFYTNRLRCEEMCALFQEAGFSVEVLKTTRWPAIPTPRRLLASEFAHLSDEELLISDFFVLLRPH